MWSLVESMKAGRCLVLTTHSMDEADALCTRIGIMAKGELRCLGAPDAPATTNLRGQTPSPLSPASLRPSMPFPSHQARRCT